MALPTLVYVGTYTGSKSKGIYLFRLETENPDVPQNITLVPLGLAAETPSPSFIELDLKRRLLFAVNELNRSMGNDDLYPFVLPPIAVEKLRFMHTAIRGM